MHCVSSGYIKCHHTHALSLFPTYHISASDILINLTSYHSLHSPYYLGLIIAQSYVMNNRNFTVQLVSPKSFPLDPRHEQTRTTDIRPAVRVYGNRKRDSSKLLSLPDEIIWIIVGFLAEEERGHFLSSFALAHRECRQLARRYQFADVWITRSETSWKFLRHLIREANDRSDDEDDSTTSIGSCIRSLTITVDEDFHRDYGLAPEDRREEWEAYWDGLIDDLAQVMEMALPNLDRVF